MVTINECDLEVLVDIFIDITEYGPEVRKLWVAGQMPSVYSPWTKNNFCVLKGVWGKNNNLKNPKKSRRMYNTDCMWPLSLKYLISDSHRKDFLTPELD